MQTELNSEARELSSALLSSDTQLNHNVFQHKQSQSSQIRVNIFKHGLLKTLKTALKSQA